jgi:hypothetical protein
MVNNSDFETSFLEENGKITWNHQEIKKWAEKHNGKPAVFDDPNALGDKLGIRIDFKGKRDERYMSVDVKTRLVTWKRFFEIFDRRNLAFVYNEKNEPVDKTLAYIFINRKNT